MAGSAPSVPSTVKFLGQPGNAQRSPLRKARSSLVLRDTPTASSARLASRNCRVAAAEIGDGCRAQLSHGTTSRVGRDRFRGHIISAQSRARCRLRRYRKIQPSWSCYSGQNLLLRPSESSRAGWRRLMAYSSRLTASSAEFPVCSWQFAVAVAGGAGQESSEGPFQVAERTQRVNTPDAPRPANIGDLGAALHASLFGLFADSCG